MQLTHGMGGAAPMRRPRDGDPPAGPTAAAVDPFRPHRSVAHDGYTVLVCGPDGRILGGKAGSKDEDGLWDLDARILSRHIVRLDGMDPRSIGACVGEADSWTSTMVVPRKGGEAEGPALPQDTRALRVDRRLGWGMAESIRLTNHSMTPGSTILTLELDADFEDRLRTTSAALERTRSVTWDPVARRLSIEVVAKADDASDARTVEIGLSLAPVGVEFVEDAEPTARRLTFAIDLEPGEGWSLELEYRTVIDGQGRAPSAELVQRRDAQRAAWRSRRTRVETNERLVGPAFERAAEDLLAMRNWDIEPSTETAWIVNAGMPGFTGFFGRDTLTAGWQAAMLGTEPLLGALAVAAATQGERDDPFTEEQPGRMVHEMRRGPLAMLGVRPHARYFGTQTAGSMFALGLSEAWHWAADDTLLQRHRASAMRAIEWAETLGDVDGDGFLEYRDRSSDGLKNHGWKDSDEAIRYPDGRIVENPIATVEEQAFHYLALQRTAEILVALGEPQDRSERLLRRAADLRRAWHDAYWMDDLGFYALALDGQHQKVETITSNPGHALASGIVPPEHAGEVADRLLATDLYSGWGIRTLSSDHPSYNPFAYHLGAVWPVENATIALGFKRYGLDDHLDQLAEGFFAAVANMRDLRLPEALTGHDRSETPTPLPYPSAQSPQAWSASATVQFVQVMLGLYPFAPAGVLGLARPRLPPWLPTITLHHLRVGDATVTIRFERADDGSASHKVIEQDGSLRIVVVPPPNAIGGSDGLLPRLTEWALEHAPGRLPAALRIATGGVVSLDHGQGGSEDSA